MAYCGGAQNVPDFFSPPTIGSFVLQSPRNFWHCVKKIKGLNKVHLVDASFVWTEPHSRRIKVKLVVQKEVTTGAVLQQSCIVEFIQQPIQCEECNRVEAKDYWRALVQVRQEASSKKAIYFLEQEILRHKLHLKMTNIKEHNGGLDFFFAERQDARKLMDFVLSILPGRHHYAQELISHDAHNNVYCYKHTYAVEIVPLCKDDVVVLPKKVAQKFGNLDQICLVSRVSTIMRLICPLSAKIAEFNASCYWQNPFKSAYITKDFVEFIVIDVEPMSTSHLPKNIVLSKKHILADVWVERSDEIGSGNTIHTRSHLGGILHPGDSVLGIDLCHSNISNDVLEQMSDEQKPDVLIIKKVQHGRKRRRRGAGGKSVTAMSDATSVITSFSDKSSDEDDIEQESGKLVDLFSSMFVSDSVPDNAIPEENEEPMVM